MGEKKLRGYLILFSAAAAWGFSFAMQKVGAEYVTPFYFNFCRFALGALSLVPFSALPLRRMGKKERKNTLKYGASAGVILYLATFLQQIGIKAADSTAKAGFITGLYMIFVPVIGYFIYGKIGRGTAVGAVVSSVGLYLLCADGSRFSLGTAEIILLISAVLYALHILYIDSSPKASSPIAFSLVQFASAAVLHFFSTALFEKFTLAPWREAVVATLYCGFVSVGLAYTAQVVGQRYLSPSKASLILSTESVFSALGGVILLRERLTVSAVFGCALMLGGIVLSGKIGERIKS